MMRIAWSRNLGNALSGTCFADGWTDRAAALVGNTLHHLVLTIENVARRAGVGDLQHKPFPRAALQLEILIPLTGQLTRRGVDVVQQPDSGSRGDE